MDEPTGNLWGKNMEGQFRAFLEYKAKANRLAPNLRVFINDVPWIDPPATEWWTKWNTAGDVSCHDNYPIKHSAQTRSISAIADTVGLAVEANHQQKPVWLSRTENPIHCLLKPHSDGSYVLLTVNLEDSVETVRFTFSTQLAALEKLFENQPAPVLLDDGKAFQDRFEPFEVHVYRLRR